jgi:hypothetical protein
MSLITLARHYLRAAKARRRNREAVKIARLEVFIEAQREQADKYLAGCATKLERLKAKHDGRTVEHDSRTSEQVRREVELSAKFRG